MLPTAPYHISYKFCHALIMIIINKTAYSECQIQYNFIITKFGGTEKQVCYVQTLLYQVCKSNRLYGKTTLGRNENTLCCNRNFVILDFVITKFYCIMVSKCLVAKEGTVYMYKTAVSRVISIKRGLP